MKKINTRRIPRKKSFTVHEFARKCRVSPATIRTHVKNGLPTIDDIYPTMIYGQDAIDYFKQLFTTTKTKLSFNEFYCLKCRCARTPKDDCATLLITHEQRGHLKAICTTCGTKMNKRISLSNLAEIEKHLTLDTETL